MPRKKTKKRKKSSRMSGRGMGTHGSGARKNNKKSGNSGGFGMAGSGKRGDQKKTLITKLYGNKYFGKKGITSKKTEKDKRKRINLRDITGNLGKYKKTSKGWEISLPKHKVLGLGDVNEKLIITCLKASKSAREKVEKAGGQIITKGKKPKKKEGKEEQKSEKKD